MKSAKKNRSVPAGSKRARLGAKAETSGPSAGAVEEQLNRRVDKLQAQLDSITLIINASVNLEASLQNPESAALRSQLEPKNRGECAKQLWDNVRGIIQPKKQSKMTQLIERMSDRMESMERWHQQQLSGAPAFGVPPAVVHDMESVENWVPNL